MCKRRRVCHGVCDKMALVFREEGAQIWAEESQPHTDRSSSYLMMVPVPLEGGCCHSNRCSLGGMLSASNGVEGGRGNGERRSRKGGSLRAFLTPRQPAHTNEPYISSAVDAVKDFHLLCITDTTKTYLRDIISTDLVCTVFLLD